MRFRLSMLVTLALFSVAATCGATAGELTDPRITDAVEEQILLDEGVWLNDIDVVTTEGVVTLSGKVNNLLAKERAARVAATVRGVRSVVNRIEVVPAESRTDAAIRRDIEMALLSNPATESFEIDPRVDNGKVTLEGTIESWAEADLAETVAKTVRGVTAVDSRLSWEFEADRSDLEIEGEVEERLRWDVLIDEDMIGVEVVDGVVRLTGTVGSAAEKRRAATKCWVAGVKKVDESRLDVVPVLSDGDVRSATWVPATDAEIRDAVKDAMLYDPRVLSTDVDVDVDAGVVTLRGQVDSLGAKRAAEADARNTTGVLSVRNRVRIRTIEPIDDEMIERRVRDALLRDPYVESYEITVDANRGIVDLYGVVDSYFEKGQADDVASKVRGVILVDNNLVVDADHYPYSYDPYVDDWYLYDYEWYDYRPRLPLKADYEIRRDIESQLWWSPFVDADQVNVEVDNGTATLTGTVDSWSERRAAQKNAFDGGASWVINDLEVDRGEG